VLVGREVEMFELVPAIRQRQTGRAFQADGLA